MGQQRVELSYLCARLQSRMNYQNPEFAFDVLLYGWAKSRKHHRNWLSDVKRRNWMTLPMARDFAHYCGYLFI